MYSDVDGTTPATNPIIADGDGFWPQRYVTESAKAVVTTSADLALYTLDPCPTSAGTGAAASAVSFNPTIDLPQTNVQDAIEAAATLAVSGFAEFGLGITGNATLLANLDATGTGAGIYRFDGTTTGIYPTGVAAADTGIYDLYRQSGSVAKAYLYPSNSNRTFERRMSASVWGTWRETPNVNQATTEGDMIYRGPSDFARLAKGTAGQSLRMNSGATAPEWGGPLTYSTPQATTSGTEFDFTSIPAGVQRVTVFFDKVSLSGTNSYQIQLGTGGAFVTSGYESVSSTIDGGAVTASNLTTGFLVLAGAAVDQMRGSLTLTKDNANQWSISGTIYRAGAKTTQVGGQIDLGGALDRLKITTTGANTFDAGAVNIAWE